ncbi:hypothetical protein Dimus_032691 [Dionaea muscipula]
MHSVVPLPCYVFLVSVMSSIIIISSAASSTSRRLLQFPNSWVPNPKSSGSAPAVFVFGDSTVDPGNNNYIPTIFKGNFPPYGRDFPDHKPTGRFSNGRLATDFTASYLGIKEYVPPYLESTLSHEELMTGVSFASALSGFDPLTTQISGVISVAKQVEYLREYKSRVEVVIGEEKVTQLMKKAVFFISAGTNDFVFNYFAVAVRQATFSVALYQQFLAQHVHHFIMELWKEGARKIVVAGLPPIGCMPIVITLYTKNLNEHRGCLDSLSSVAREFNHLLQLEINATSHKLATADHRTKLVYADIYDQLESMIRNPTKFGFQEVSKGCCGTGYLEAAFLCNPLSPVCEDASEYLFWDSVHPTERTYDLLSKAFRPHLDFLLRD